MDIQSLPIFPHTRRDPLKRYRLIEFSVVEVIYGNEKFDFCTAVVEINHKDEPIAPVSKTVKATKRLKAEEEEEEEEEEEDSSRGLKRDRPEEEEEEPRSSKKRATSSRVETLQVKGNYFLTPFYTYTGWVDKQTGSLSAIQSVERNVSREITCGDVLKWFTRTKALRAVDTNRYWMGQWNRMCTDVGLEGPSDVITVKMVEDLSASYRHIHRLFDGWFLSDDNRDIALAIGVHAYRKHMSDGDRKLLKAKDPYELCFIDEWPMSPNRVLHCLPSMENYEDLCQAYALYGYLSDQRSRSGKTNVFIKSKGLELAKRYTPSLSSAGLRGEIPFDMEVAAAFLTSRELVVTTNGDSWFTLAGVWKKQRRVHKMMARLSNTPTDEMYDFEGTVNLVISRTGRRPHSLMQTLCQYDTVSFVCASRTARVHWTDLLTVIYGPSSALPENPVLVILEADQLSLEELYAILTQTRKFLKMIVFVGEAEVQAQPPFCGSGDIFYNLCQHLSSDGVVSMDEDAELNEPVFWSDDETETTTMDSRVLTVTEWMGESDDDDMYSEVELLRIKMLEALDNREECDDIHLVNNTEEGMTEITTLLDELDVKDVEVQCFASSPTKEPEIAQMWSSQFSKTTYADDMVYPGYHVQMTSRANGKTSLWCVKSIEQMYRHGNTEPVELELVGVSQWRNSTISDYFLHLQSLERTHQTVRVNMRDYTVRVSNCMPLWTYGGISLPVVILVLDSKTRRADIRRAIFTCEKTLILVGDTTDLTRTIDDRFRPHRSLALSAFES